MSGLWYCSHAGNKGKKVEISRFEICDKVSWAKIFSRILLSFQMIFLLLSNSKLDVADISCEWDKCSIETCNDKWSGFWPMVGDTRHKFCTDFGQLENKYNIFAWFLQSSLRFLSIFCLRLLERHMATLGKVL